MKESCDSGDCSEVACLFAVRHLALTIVERQIQFIMPA
jgi:hypothetical protein